jgi:hypothetical protein
MKQLTAFFILFLISFFITDRASSQDFSLAIDYLYGEKSKDSHSIEESYAISNTSVAYSVKYTGHKGKNQEDMEKTCVFTEQDLANVKKTIETKGLNVTDSLLSKLVKMKSYEIFTRINISINMDGHEYKITINGDTAEFKDETLYKNTEFFIAMLRNMVEGCK